MLVLVLVLVLALEQRAGVESSVAMVIASENSSGEGGPQNRGAGHEL